MGNMKNFDYFDTLLLSPAEMKKRQLRRGWALSNIGFIVYALLRIFVKPKEYRGICPYFEIGNGGSGVSFGWFFVCGRSASESTKMHEVGHCIQNAAVGGIRMLFFSMLSVARYWKRAIFVSKTNYDDWWFEGQATRIGRSYVKTLQMECKENKKNGTH